jgi:hypothetical protein
MVKQRVLRNHASHRAVIEGDAPDAGPAARDDPGLVKVCLPEARRLLRPATTLMSRARGLGHVW